MIYNSSDDWHNCYITPEEWEKFRDEWCGETPCSEYGDCFECPYSKKGWNEE